MKLWRFVFSIVTYVMTFFSNGGRPVEEVVKILNVILERVALHLKGFRIQCHKPTNDGKMIHNVEKNIKGKLLKFYSCKFTNKGTNYIY